LLGRDIVWQTFLVEDGECGGDEKGRVTATVSSLRVIEEHAMPAWPAAGDASGSGLSSLFSSLGT